MIYESLRDRRVLVTGGSSGIGAVTAELFARQGCFVGVHYFRTETGGQKTLDNVNQYSRGCLLKADMRNEDAVGGLIAAFVEQAGGLDILVNNAGTLIERADIETMSLALYEDLFATNTRSVFLATRAALPHLKMSQGCVINVGSIAGHTGGGGGSGVYAAAKAAVATLTIAMAREFGKYRIRVNSVLPGLIETRFHEQFSTPERRAKVAKDTPLGRNGAALDVARAIVFLASDQAEFINGEYLAVNGGQYMRA